MTQVTLKKFIDGKGRRIGIDNGQRSHKAHPTFSACQLIMRSLGAEWIKNSWNSAKNGDMVVSGSPFDGWKCFFLSSPHIFSLSFLSPRDAVELKLKSSDQKFTCEAIVSGSFA